MQLEKKYILIAIVLGFISGSLVGYETAVVAVKHAQEAAALAQHKAHAKSVGEQHRKMFGDTQKGVDAIGNIP